MFGVITTRPWPRSVGVRYWYCIDSDDTPCGTSTWNAYTSSGSRFHSRRWPLAVISRPALLSIGPAVRWLPGSHAGHDRLVGPAATAPPYFVGSVAGARTWGPPCMRSLPDIPPRPAAEHKSR